MSIRLKKYTRKPSFIECVWEERNSQGEYEEKSCKFKEAPHPILATAVLDLKNSIKVVLEVPVKWMESVAAVGGFSVHRTEAGVRSLEVKFTKGFKIGNTKEYTTPQFRIDPADEAEDNQSVLWIDDALLCVTAIDAVEAYIQGDRQQMTLDGIEKTVVGANEAEGKELDLEAEEE
jgi:hypothetical protein